MPGRVMREYVVVPSRLVAERGALVQWLGEAFRYARTLPPKAKRPAIRAPTTTAAPRASKTAPAARARTALRTTPKRK
jgi:hypothetical protein